jgi:hypothetical protein
MAKMDAKMRVMEAMSKLTDSVAASVSSSIQAADRAIQFYMNMIKEVGSLYHDSFSRLVGNLR